MLLSDGRFVMAYCSTNLHWITRKAPFGKAKLLDQDIEIDFQQHTKADDIVSVISTLPLTGNESWQKFLLVSLFYLIVGCEFAVQPFTIDTFS